MPRADRVKATTRRMIEYWVTIIAWSELFGGPAAAVAFAIDLRGPASAGLPRWSFEAALGFCVLSFIAGGLLLRDSWSGRALSTVVQVAQLLRVTVGGVTVRVAAGLAATIWYARPGGWDGVLGATAAFRVGRAPTGHVEFGINFVALFAVYALLRPPRRLSTVAFAPGA